MIYALHYDRNISLPDTYDAYISSQSPTLISDELKYVVCRRPKDYLIVSVILVVRRPQRK